MRLLCGTSGYSYDAWKGTFYPADLKKDRMLGFYASRLPTVEINNTFYRMPRSGVVEKWRDEVPDGFRFVLKASRRITHFARLVDCEETLSYLFRVADHLGAKLGPVLFQLPPMVKKDPAVLEAFLSLVPADRRVAFEFRHPSWFDDDALDVLSRFGAALVGGDVDDAGKSPPLVRTAPFGYLRLRRSDYDAAEIEAWYERIVEQRWDEAFAFFKHESRGPELAASLLARAA
jgi:uncharacterized protein YecE (DUF72 family)